MIIIQDTIAAIATGFSVSAIGIVRLSGPQAHSMADELFRPRNGRKMSESPDRLLCYGELCTRGGEILDICMCTLSRAPNTYTGEDTAEFQCHGSPLVLRSLLEELNALGARQAKPGEFTKRAFLNGRMELSSAEAVADIIEARSVEAMKNAAGQLSGALARKAEEVYSLLADICSHYHAVLDYPDEYIEEFEIAAYEGELRDAEDTLRRLSQSYSRGKLLNSGIPAAIVGRPNAGKSSLMNMLLGYERAIVTPSPGTTRDTIEERVQIGGVTLLLIDTAGIRETEDEAELQGVCRSRRAAEEAELIIAVIDGSEEISEADHEIMHLAESAERAIVVLNKLDLSTFRSELNTALPLVELSSLTGEGMSRLESCISELFPLPELPAGEILTNARQAEAVDRALDFVHSARAALESGTTPDIVLTECEGAMDAIGELSGRSIREDVTERIFQRFCVGK